MKKHKTCGFCEEHCGNEWCVTNEGNDLIIKDSKDIQKVLDFIANNDILAYDIETTGLNPRSDEVIGFGVSNTEEGFYVAHKSYNGDSLDTLVELNDCVKVLEALKSKKLLTWNGSFDTRFTKHYFKVNLINSIFSDGMLSKHTVDEERPFRLKEVAQRLYGSDAAEEQRLMKESIKNNGGSATEYFKADLELMAKYCIQDCILTAKIDGHYRDLIAKEGLSSFYANKEVCPMYKEVIIPMEDKGLNLDIRKISEAHVSITVDIEELEASIQADIAPLLDEFNKWFLWKEYPPRRSGSFAQAIAEYMQWNLPKTETGKYSITAKTLETVPDSDAKTFLQGGAYLDDELVQKIQMRMHNGHYLFNLSSKHHLKKLFFEKLEETPINTTDKGNPQVDHLFLLKMADKYDWVKNLIVYNKLNKIKSAYFDRYLENHENGKFYPSWFMHRTTSGRLGGDMMQMPRKLEEGHPLVLKYNNIIRDCIIAGEGRKLVGADYSSLEVVVFADDAGDEVLLDMIRNNQDFYSLTALGVHNLGHQYSADKKADNFLKKHKPELRQQAKAYSLGIRYGLKSFKLSKDLGIEQNEADQIVNKYYQSYPKLKQRMDELIQFAKEHGFVKSKGGRVRHLPLLKKLHYAHGDILENSLELWKKFNENPKKYQQMKYLAKQYRSMINNSLNFPIQSMAASITNRACIAIMREFKRLNLDAYICMQIHDEIVVNCADKDVDRVKKIMRYLMENVTKLSVPLNAEPEVGDCYGEIK